MNNRIRVSSGSMSASTSRRDVKSSVSAATAVSLSRRAISLRMWSVIRRDATWISQPRGFSGRPSCGHWVKAAIMASCTASSAEEKSRKRRATAPSTCGASPRNRCSEVASHLLVIELSLQHIRRRSAHDLAYFDRHVQRRTSGARRGGNFGGNLIRSLRTVNIDHPEAGEELFGFGENTVRDRLAILVCADQFRLIGKRQPFR